MSLNVLAIFWSHVRPIAEQTHGKMESRKRCFHLVMNMGQRKDSEYKQRMTFIMSLFIIESLWLSGRASESGIHRSEVRFFMGTQNFFSVPCSWQDKNIFLHFFTELKTYHLFYPVYILNGIYFLNNKMYMNVPGKYHSAGCFPAIDEVRWTYWGLCCFHSTHRATDTFLWKRQTPQER